MRAGRCYSGLGPLEIVRSPAPFCAVSCERQQTQKAPEGSLFVTISMVQ